MATAPGKGAAAAKRAPTPPPKAARPTTARADRPPLPTRLAAWAAAAGRAARAALPSRRIRLIDILRVLGLAGRGVPAPVEGPKAYVQWWQRILALLVLFSLVLVIGFVLAAAVGLMVVVAGFLLEQAIA